MSVSIQPRASATGSEPQVDLFPISALLRFLWQNRQFDGLALAIGLTFVPISIAVTETFLAVALLLRLMNVARHRVSLRVPKIFWIWLIWAGMQLLSWSASPDPRAGWGEIRHSLLIGALFLIVPALQGTGQRVAVWQGIFLASTLGSIFLVGDFASRLIYYRREISVADDPSLYLRSGGLLNHWMIFATIEILVFAALLAYSRLYPEKRRFWAPVLAINAIAIVISLTRMLWICCFLLLAAELVWRRSKWVWSLTLLPLVLYFVVPAAIRARVRVSMQPGYYSNAERIEMLRVGWKMIRARPLTGVGPGRVGKLYRSFLSPADPIPAFYGHLHNNLVQIAAEFGLPVAVAGVFLAAALFNEIRKAWKAAVDTENQFLCSAALLGLSVFLLAGGVEYTYGHSLGLIMLSFVVLSPLNPAVASPVEEGSGRRSSNQAPAPNRFG